MLAFSSVPSRAVAKALADGLVGDRLAACVATLPGVSSTYRWEGKIETEEELLLLIKTRAELMDKVSAFVRKNHPYDVPELIAVPATAGLPEYLKWIGNETVAAGKKGGGGAV